MSISIDLARKVLEASKQRARDLRSPVSIAIVDAGGHLVLFERMMAPYGWATGNISLAKANTAVMFNQSTDAVAQWGASIPGFSSSLAAMTDGKFIMAAGGWPIRLNGVTVGGIGVSGGNAPGRDDEIARAGLAVVEAAGAPTPAQRVPVQQATPVPVQRGPVAAPPLVQQQVAPAYNNVEQAAYYEELTPSANNNEDNQSTKDVPSTHHLSADKDDPDNAYHADPSTPSNEDRPGDQ